MNFTLVSSLVIKINSDFLLSFNHFNPKMMFLKVRGGIKKSSQTMRDGNYMINLEHHTDPNHLPRMSIIIK